MQVVRPDVGAGADEPGTDEGSGRAAHDQDRAADEAQDRQDHGPAVHQERPQRRKRRHELARAIGRKEIELGPELRAADEPHDAVKRRRVDVGKRG